MTIKSAEELLAYELQDIEDAENQASEAIKRLSKEAQNTQLRRMLDTRLQQGERLLKDVQGHLQKLDGKNKRTQNAAARGLITETEKLLREVEVPEMKEAVMIAGAQKLEHYCIATWGTVKAMASELGEQELADTMQRALDEGYRWDHEMTALAEHRVNPSAVEQSAG